ncbi:type II secretion system protein N [Teredinibacter haidensis]|uniref:type II secretion system protein N n=1 Tax=Teredinibacter haidensis TaxID=2731755 RepID=UPI000948BB16|nr:type II secretion system protein N [Teredinibacter haidensis]
MTFRKKLIKPTLITFLVLYFLYLVLSRAPAEIAASVMHKTIPNLWLTGVEGSVWEGKAKGAQLDLANSALPLGSLTWSLSAWSLLMLKPCVSFETRGGGPILSGVACQSIAGSTSLKDVSIETAIAPFGDVLGAPLSGQGSVNIISAKLSNRRVEKMDARVSWQNGSINPGEGWVVLGSYGATVSENNQGGIKAKITDLDAPLQVDLTAEASLNSWQVVGSVTPQANAHDLLKGGIQLIGEETEPGTYEVQWSSQ